MVSQVAWADDENGSDADLKTLLEPTVVISPTLYDGFVADRNKSSGGATLNATKNTCDLRSAALGAFADYLFEEEEELKQALSTPRATIEGGDNKLLRKKATLSRLIPRSTFCIITRR